MKLVSRQCAIREGLKHYFTGRSCKYGHVAKRSTCNGVCVECRLLRVRRWRAVNREKAVAASRKWYAVNSEKSIAASRKWYSANSEKRIATSRKWYVANRARAAEWHARRRACLRSQVCQCCTPEQRTVWYAKAKMAGVTVDHIIPVSKGGRHCVHNMQLLSRVENSRKRDRYSPLVEGIQYLRKLGLA